ncbi:MAG: ABC transporter substrate-binding protein, partial [Hyphomicrobiales bacterium]|nr:ABC transporter substrate-binding protein [Hyphomicrobiales bacterium]
IGKGITGALTVALASFLVSTAALAQGDIAVKMDPKLHAMLPKAVRDKGVVTGATSASVPPLLYLDTASNQITGAVADLTHAYAARLGIKVELVKTSGDAVIPGVLANRYDIVASMGDFISRRDKLDFVDIVKGGNALVTKKGNPAKVAGIDDLCGRRLALNKGSIQERRAGAISEACVKAGKPAVEVMAYADGPTSVLALQSGRADVQWDDIASAYYKVAKNPNDFEVAGKPQDQDAPYGVGFPKDQAQFRDAVYAALQSLHKDGTYAKILAKWGVAEIALPEIVINGSKY